MVKFRIVLTTLRIAAHILLIETGSWINPKPIALENRKWYGILFTCIMSCFSNFKCFETEIRHAKYFSINYFSVTVMVVFIMLMLVVKQTSCLM